MTKRKISWRRGIWVILAGIWMGVIFGFSAQTGEESTGVSMRVSRAVGGVLVEGFDEMDEEGREKVAEDLQFPVRKMAHFSEYFILGILLFLATRRFPFAFAIGAGYAALDEFHQIFISGRDSMPRDVLIDIAGVLVGLGVIFLFRKVGRRRKKIPQIKG